MLVPARDLVICAACERGHLDMSQRCREGGSRRRAPVRAPSVTWMLGIRIWRVVLMALVVAACSSPSSRDVDCQSALFVTGLPNPDAQAATTSSDMEVWGLFYPSDPPVAGDPIVIDVADVWGPGDAEPRRGTKIVWRSTGEGAFSVNADGPVAPLSNHSSRSDTAARIGLDPATSGAPCGSFPRRGVGGSQCNAATRPPRSVSRFEPDAVTRRSVARG